MRSLFLVVLLMILLVGCQPQTIIAEPHVDSGDTDATIVNMNPRVYRVVDRDFDNVCYVSGGGIFCMELE